MNRSNKVNNLSFDRDDFLNEFCAGVFLDFSNALLSFIDSFVKCLNDMFENVDAFDLDNAFANFEEVYFDDKKDSNNN